MIRDVDLAEPFEVKIRYRSQAALGRVANSSDSSQTQFAFESPQRSVTPGQIAVLYRGDEVLGGGFIGRVGVS